MATLIADLSKLEQMPVPASDPEYLQWIVEKSELEEGIKHSARYWLTAASR